MGTVDAGPPLADLAYPVRPVAPPHDGVMRGMDGSGRVALGIPTEDEFIAQYCRRPDTDAIEQWDFHAAFRLVRLIAIVQGVRRRAQAGERVIPMSRLALEVVGRPQ